jgi:hypothetical protein
VGLFRRRKSSELPQEIYIVGEKPVFDYFAVGQTVDGDPST